ncbi:MAG: tRNA (adenosine(37)-N6)-dimethylallyltransferase MiaA [Pseudomonadota bacterium]|nr:tRNA (adenosine(37)-N6)-dimethylallyltransferase MiaA [Pseudomonadota bacterium]
MNSNLSGPRALLIAGPTASGKSALALRIARERGATLVNADSMQVYRDLRVLTARPPVEEERLAPHLLFGEIDGAENFSVGRYEARAREILARVAGAIVFVGGTGLYFRALTQGLSEMPAVPDEIRARVRESAVGRETPALHENLARVDPASAARLRPSDRQRILRALEVHAASGRSLSEFQRQRGEPALRAGEWRGLFLAPEREALKRRIAERFAVMLQMGALAEVAALAARGLDPALPIMRAHGAPHLMAHLRGEMSLEAAAALGVRDTKAYAKRQFTWARHQLPDFTWIAPEDAARALG